MKISIRQNLLLFSFIILAAIGLTGYAFYQSEQKLRISAQWVRHTEQVIEVSGNILSLAKDMETSARGFVITGDSAFLQPLDSVEKTSFAHIAQIKFLTQDNPAQQQLTDSLLAYMHRVMDFSFRSIELRSTQGLSAAIIHVSTSQGKYYTDRIRQITALMQQGENALLEERTETNRHSRAMFNIYLSALYVLIGIFSIILLINITNHWRQQARTLITNQRNAELHLEAIDNTAKLSIREDVIAFQNDEREERAAELAYQNKEKEQRKVEKDLQQIQNESRLIRAQRVSHMGSWELDFKTYTIHLSAEACRIVGLDPSDNRKTFTECEAFIHPDDMDSIVTLIKEAQGSLSDTSFDHRILRKDGAVRYLHSESKFEVDTNGKPNCLYGIAYDITDKKKAEELHEFDKNNLSALINNTNDLMWSVDRDFKLITYNQPMDTFTRKITGRALTKGADMDSIEFADGMAATYRKLYERAFVGETFTEIEHITTPAEAWSEISFHPIRSGTEIIGTACHAHDITNINKAKNEIFELNETLEDRVLERTTELVEANKALEAFSYSVSHDLRAPIRTVVGFIKIIEQDYGASMEPELKELFGYIHDSGRRMNAIIDDLLKLAQFGKKALKPEPVNIGQMIKDIWSNIGRHSELHAILELGELPTVQADMSMMDQVLINLLSNAIKYSSKNEHPVVTIWFEQKEGKKYFYFKDNGVGFDMKNYHRLFGAFQRLHGMSEFEGTGVGLMLVKSIIEKHGGTIGAESKVNEGATFYFALPSGGA